MSTDKRAMNATVTLCMIVKNESHIIHECLESIYPFINRYDITDTGSTDGTQDIIREFFEKRGIPGEVHQSDWKGFGKSRTESLVNAKNGGADYAWVIDADDKITGTFEYPEDVSADAYSLRIGKPEFTWFRNQIFSLKRNWEYVGVLHEYANCEGCENLVQIRLEGKYFVEARTLGARNVDIDPKEKYSKDAELLLNALTNPEDINYEPDNARYQFYLAQSYFDSQQFEKAEEAYQKRVEMKGWEEEVFYSLYRLAIIGLLLEKPFEQVMLRFLTAWEYRPIRAEPLYELSRLFRNAGHPRLGYLYAKMALGCTYPENDILFIATDVYDWKIADEIAAGAFYVHQWQEGYNACRYILDNDKAPESEVPRIQENMKHYLMKIQEVEKQRVEHEAQAELMKQQRSEKEKAEKKQAKIENATRKKGSSKDTQRNAKKKKVRSK